jgi:hypothetical protein
VNPIALPVLSVVADGALTEPRVLAKAMVPALTGTPPCNQRTVIQL